MIGYGNECRDCATEGYPCRGMSCDYRKSEKHICDDCGDDGKLYYFDGGEYCIECIEQRLERVR